MYIKRYSIAAILLIGLVGWYVFAFVTHESMSIDVFGIHLPSLTIALWVIAPLVLLYVFSVFHISFYSMMGNFKLRKYEKDYEKIIDSIVEAYLGKKERNHIFKTDRYRLLGSLVDNTVLFPNQNLSVETTNTKINNVVKLIENIKNGEVVDLKQYGLLSSNAMVIQNERNKYKKGDLKADDILAHQAKYDKVLCNEVYIDYCKKAPLASIEKYKSFMCKESLFLVLGRINAVDFTLEASNEAIISLLKSVTLDKKDYLKVSATLGVGMIPEQRMKLFESIIENNEDATDAYLYTLFDLELLAPADELLENTQPDEYLNFKAYRALKECNKNFNINLFV